MGAHDWKGRLSMVSQKAKWRGRFLSVFTLGTFLMYPQLPLVDQKVWLSSLSVIYNIERQSNYYLINVTV